MRNAILPLILLATGCANRALVDSYRGYHQRLGVEYIAYVRDDPKLTDLDKRARVLLHEAAARVIEEAEDE